MHPTSIKRAFFLFVLFFTDFCISGQTVENISFRQEEDTIIINYDLISKKGTLNEITFDVSVYYRIAGQDIFQPVVTATGDLGRKIFPGENKVVSWDVTSDLDELEGEVQFRVVAVKHVYYENIWNANTVLANLLYLTTSGVAGASLTCMIQRKAGIYGSFFFYKYSEDIKYLSITGGINFNIVKFNIKKAGVLYLNTFASIGRYTDTLWDLKEGTCGEIGVIFCYKFINIAAGLQINYKVCPFLGFGLTF